MYTTCPNSQNQTVGLPFYDDMLTCLQSEMKNYEQVNCNIYEPSTGEIDVELLTTYWRDSEWLDPIFGKKFPDFEQVEYIY